MGSLRDIARGRDKELKSMSFIEFLLNVFLTLLGMGLIFWGVTLGVGLIGESVWWLALVFVAVGIPSLIWGFKRAGDWLQAVFELSTGLGLVFISLTLWGSILLFGIGLFFIVIGLLEYRANRRMVG